MAKYIGLVIYNKKLYGFSNINQVNFYMAFPDKFFIRFLTYMAKIIEFLEKKEI